MIFCKSRKFIFIRVPKNASTSLSLQIQKNTDFQSGDFATSFNELPPVGFENIKFDCGPILSNLFKFDEHAPLNKLLDLNIIQPEELHSFSIYGILRDPVDRFFSSFSHMISSHPRQRKDTTLMDKEELASLAFSCLEESKNQGRVYQYHDDLNKLGRNYPMYPQAHWLMHDGKPINNIIIFPKFEDMLMKLTGESELQFREKVGKRPIQCEVSQSTINKIHEWYAEDFELWERFNK